MNNWYIFILSLIIWKCVCVLFDGEFSDELKDYYSLYKLLDATGHSVAKQIIKLM